VARRQSHTGKARYARSEQVKAEGAVGGESGQPVCRGAVAACKRHAAAVGWREEMASAASMLARSPLCHRHDATKPPEAGGLTTEWSVAGAAQGQQVRRQLCQRQWGHGVAHVCW